MDKSLISKNASNIIKGILIILIVIGHNTILTTNIKYLTQYLYSFHIFGFFLLPWLYNKKPINWQTIKKRFIIIYTPYLFFYVLLYFIYNFIYTNNGFCLNKFVLSFVFGGFNLKESTGYILLWFLPAYFFSMFLKDLYYTIKARYRVLFFITTLCYSLYINFIYKSIIPISFITLNNFVLQGLYFVSFGVITRYIIEYMQNKQSISVYINYFCLVLFVSMSVITLIYPLNMFIFSAFPIIFFILLYWLANKLNGNCFLFKIGKVSLSIYLTHSLVFYFFYTIMCKFNISVNLFSGILVFIITFCTSYFISYFMMKSKFVTKYIFGIK